jgi:hypothetical protein
LFKSDAECLPVDSVHDSCRFARLRDDGCRHKVRCKRGRKQREHSHYRKSHIGEPRSVRGQRARDALHVVRRSGVGMRVTGESVGRVGGIPQSADLLYRGRGYMYRYACRFLLYKLLMRRQGRRLGHRVVVLPVAAARLLGCAAQAPVRALLSFLLLQLLFVSLVVVVLLCICCSGCAGWGAGALPKYALSDCSSIYQERPTFVPQPCPAYKLAHVVAMVSMLACGTARREVSLTRYF